ncbi:chromosome segregation protein SMC, partial [Melissococcus plutonius]
PQLAQLENSETELYNKRRTIGQIKEQKKKYAKEMPFFPEAPKELVSISELVNQQQEILARNGQNQLKRQQLNEITRQAETEQFQIEQLEQQLNELKAKHTQTLANLETAQKSAIALQDESTEELEKNIAEIDEINRRVRINLDKEKAEEDASDYQKQYDTLTSDIELIRQKKLNLLTSAELPLPGLSVEEGELIYNGQKWDNMSGSDQLKVSTAIVRKLKPQCGFVLLDKLEQMDMNTLNEFSQWLQQEGLQAIATRVSTGDECSIIIEDGYVAENNLVRQGSDMVGTPKINKWEGAAF